MKNKILSEKEFQKYILSKLKENGYEIWPSSNYDQHYAISRKELFRFLYSTQPESMKKLNKIYKADTESAIINMINAEETKSRGSRLDVLKHGIDISHVHLDLLYSKPETTFNKELNSLYEQNIFSVSEEVWASDKERIDLVIFLNGLAIITFELKANTSGQSVKDAIHQYRTERDPSTRLFRFKSGVLVNFAMDLEQVYMTTKLEGESTVFLPFNMGDGEGVHAGAGNPILENEFSVHYMWDDILKKDSIMEIITRFMFIDTKEKRDENTGKTKISKLVIFPRYHQLDVLRKIIADVLVNRTSQNYLLQHSAGSGKTNEIAWLSYRLASLHDTDNNIIFDNVVICTDRVVVDRQLQQAVLGLEHKSGFIRVMNDDCNSTDLALALSGHTKIIVTTIQKFPHIIGQAGDLADKNFAVIIDEAHSSTAGKNLASMTYALSEKDIANAKESDIQEKIAEIIDRHGKQPNVSMFAFTATPKATTLKLFGRPNKNGINEPFHTYSMKQAIEEGFIIDVLQNYTTYNTFYKLNKEIEEDPIYKTKEAKRKIANYINLHEVNVAQRTEIMVEHYMDNVRYQLGGQAKAMIVTESRAAAVKYKLAIDKYIKEKGYDIKTLVAFSGTVELNSKEYTETGMNGISEKNLPAEFDKDDYQLLIVADKYLTGFDQKKLCAMYILKKLHGVATVQTLSRLNRIYPPYNKKTFILDFANDYDSIIKDFSEFYTTTLLANSFTPSAIYDIEAKIDNFFVINPIDVEELNRLFYKKDITIHDKMKMASILQSTKKKIETGRTQEQKNEIILTMKHFIRFYEFLIQATRFEDVELYKKYNFINCLIPYLSINSPVSTFSLKGKIKATRFTQKKEAEYLNTNIESKPYVNLPVADEIITSSDKTQHLSEIIKEINSTTGKNYDNDVAVKAMLQIKTILMNSEKLKSSAKNNTEKDFEFAFFDIVDEALIEGLNQNNDLFTLLLQNEEIKRKLLGAFTDEIYWKLKEQRPA